MRKIYAPTYKDLNIPFLEQKILKKTHQYCKGLEQINLFFPFYVCLTLIGIKGYKVPSVFGGPNFQKPIDRNILILPEFEINQISQEQIGKSLLPIFEMIWNACNLRHPEIIK